MNANVNVSTIAAWKIDFSRVAMSTFGPTLRVWVSCIGVLLTHQGRGDKAHAPLPTAAELAKRKAEQEADQFTMYLSRPDRETKPWYTDREFKRVEDAEAGDEAEFRRARDR
jgi:hypothetical protein